MSEVPEFSEGQMVYVDLSAYDREVRDDYAPAKIQKVHSGNRGPTNYQILLIDDDKSALALGRNLVGSCPECGNRPFYNKNTGELFCAICDDR